MLIHLDIKIPHLQIAHQGDNLEVGNIKIYLEGRKLKNSLFANTYQAAMVKLWFK